MTNPCEVRDYVVWPDGSRVVRQQNEAANTELVRRGEPGAVVPSGEVPPYAIVWVNTCGGEVIDIPVVVA